MRPAPGDYRARSAEHLARSALAGHPAAWDEMVRRYTHRVVLSLLARGVPLDAAEDLAQETWIHLLQQQRAGRLSSMRMPGLAIAQARWLAREMNRTQSRRVALMGEGPAREPLFSGPEDPCPDCDPEARRFDEERLEHLERELERCPARAREIFREAYAEHAPSHAEVARDHGLSVQRVRQILCEVRARLRVALNDLDHEDERWRT